MELDELKSAWQILDRRMDQQYALNLDIHRQGKTDRARSSLRPLFWGQIVQIFFGVVLVAMGVSFWSTHREVTHLLVVGISIHVYGVLCIIAAGLTLAMIRRVDYAAPVVAIQKQLAQLRRFYVISGLVLGLSWWWLWVPVVMLLAQTYLGADLYLRIPEFVWWNLAAGTVGAFASWWFIGWARHPRRPRLAKAVDDSLTGSSLQRAQKVLDEIKRFERD